MSDLRDLYQEVILDHGRNPRNYGKLENANRLAKGYNPLCGDRFTIYLFVEEGIVRDIRFEGSGCAIALASASMMTEDLKGRSEEDAEKRFEQFHTLLTGDPSTREGAGDPSLGKLAVFSGVREFPVRVKCATLPWHAFEAALKEEGETATTE
ncbi:MAG: SUF system NifU family Fe-S cluster assembly protein [Candidatus Eisenbacteria bacterium]|nr:SUF system NifU family Fe-S cluster assembly protein [Candidatus Eisenbacteria bacterium]